MASKIVNALEILKDGKWHTLAEIQEKLGISEEQIKRTTEFLTEYEFIISDEEKKRIKLNRDAKKFLANTATV
jgi:DNA-binding IclR family transcriptional regulator